MRNQEDRKVPELWGGIECTINRVQDRFFDQLQYSGHYQRVSDIDQVAETGIKKVRYPILWEKHQPEKDSVIDWRWATERLEKFRQLNIDVIAGLVHHGSGPSYTNMLDDSFPTLLASYAERVIQQFPFLSYFTPVNEPLTTARFSGLYGLWYPHKNNDRAFLKMLLNEMKAVVLSMQAIRKVNPEAKLVQTEDLGKTYSTKSLQYQAKFENERRWLTYDLLCGKVAKQHPMWRYLLRSGVTEKELHFFLDNVCVPDTFGFNHYLTSERFLDGRLNRYPKHTHGGNGYHAYADVEAVRVELKEETGIEVLLKEAWQRYQKPIALTEVHLHCHREDQVRWFKHVWETCNRLRTAGVKVEAVTSWAMLGSYGWNKLLTEPDGEYEPGVFDVRSGTPRPTALTGFLKKINSNEHFLHPLSEGKGWWHRSNRFFHRSLQSAAERINECTAPILIVGKNGTLGRAFGKVCEQRFIHFKLLSREECDISDISSVQAAIEKYRPWAIINAAGFVRVDAAEFEKERCLLVNGLGASNLATAAGQYGIKLVTFSSDLVFDGRKGSAYVEEDNPNPLNVYGRSKAQAEEAISKINSDALIIRTSAFFGPWDEYNFANYVRKSLLNEEVVNVAKDAVVSPTYIPDLVHATLDLLVDDEKGIWHLANNGEITWVDFANEIADRFGLNRQYINAISTEEFRFAAKRPLYSVLSSNRGILLPSLDNALRRYTEEMKTIVQREKQAQRKERA